MTGKILNCVAEFSDEAKKLLALPGVTVNYQSNITKEDLLKEVGDYQVLIVRIGLTVDKELIDQASNLKIIATTTTGLDHIDVGYALSKGIKIISLKDEISFLKTITSTAELAFTLILNLSRHILPASLSVKQGKWELESFRGQSLYRKNLGVVGLGRLGEMVARYGQAFGMKVIFTDPNVSAQAFPDYEKVDFETLLKRSDAISIHVHLSKETENMFTTKEFKQMKPTAILVNTSRGKIVNEKDLLAALENKTIAGYGTDVLADELNFNGLIPNDHLLVNYAKNHDNAIILPHIGGLTFESRRDTDVFIAQKVVQELAANLK